jgi:glycosyltransferase involved in cell wall biosynthesis
MQKNKKVLFIVPYPLRHAPSQRFRVELFLPHLSESHIQYRVVPFLDRETILVLYKKGFLLKKASGILKGYLKRLITLFFQVPFYDYIFIHREAAPLGPPFFEFVTALIFRKKIIYDFDDAIWIPDLTARWLAWIKAFWKIKWICKWADKVVAGNEYLCSYAGSYNSNVILIPTCVDTNCCHNSLKDQHDRPLTIGWTGSHSTLKYLDPLVPLLSSLAKSFSIRVLVICNQPPSFSFEGLEYIKWSEENEISDLLQVNIGIMPLTEDAWSEGKCGFKLIQYLALGIPAVASPVGVNTKIIGKDNSSLLCRTEDEWRTALTCLITNENLRDTIGKAGRKKIVTSFSIQAYEARFLSLFV